MIEIITKLGKQQTNMSNFLSFFRHILYLACACVCVIGFVFRIRAHQCSEKFAMDQ